MIVCDICGAQVQNGRKHRAWHDVLDATLDIHHAHQENLIERVYALEGGDEAES